MRAEYRDRKEGEERKEKGRGEEGLFLKIKSNFLQHFNTLDFIIII